jgi:hypothetical protein
MGRHRFGAHDLNIHYSQVDLSLQGTHILVKPHDIVVLWLDY